MRHVVQSENFVSEITPYLDRLAVTLIEAREVHDRQQDRQKKYSDKSNRPSPEYNEGDKVMVALHTKSSTDKKTTAKFDPKRDGPYMVSRQLSATSYEVAHPNSIDKPLGVYHSSSLTPYTGPEIEVPVVPIRKRGRPRKNLN